MLELDLLYDDFSKLSLSEITKKYHGHKHAIEIGILYKYYFENLVWGF